MVHKKKIQQWFSKTWGGGLILPDGWFGKPYDNIYQLTQLDEKVGDLRLVLDDGQLTLHFFGEVQLVIGENEIEFYDFDWLEFYWNAHGASKPQRDTYDSGSIKIVAPPGA